MVRTTISIPIEVKKRLTNYGNMDESYSDVIIKLMNAYDELQLIKNESGENNLVVNDELINSLKDSIKQELIGDEDLNQEESVSKSQRKSRSRTSKKPKTKTRRKNKKSTKSTKKSDEDKSKKEKIDIKKNQSKKEESTSDGEIEKIDENSPEAENLETEIEVLEKRYNIKL
ncbi:hypothetical protein [uncultured Methanobrevibacter sp.]|uniref:hypothetical protein n=1 Tax=uncultured Methanobrevibacter sp. TaxID=253161 RepID=UPI0025D1E9C6|nr:hypothetical protein [uncultured Methanobrevibacter sp.]